MVKIKKSMVSCRVCGKIIKKQYWQPQPQRCSECFLRHLKEHPEEHSKFKNGRIKTTQGYYQIMSPFHPNRTKRGYVLEHRLVIEKIIGRYLRKGEFVHHINGIKSDNRAENLVLCQSHKDHWAHHVKNGPCKICGGPHEAKGFCKVHHDKFRRGTHGVGSPGQQPIGGANGTSGIVTAPNLAFLIEHDPVTMIKS
jgi:hypothetical protein